MANASSEKKSTHEKRVAEPCMRERGGDRSPRLTLLLGYGLAAALGLCGCGGDTAPPPPLPTQKGIDASAADPQADPCADFYQYACGGFTTSNPVGDDGASTARRDQAYFASENAEVAIVSNPKDAAGGLVRDYVKACSGASKAQDRSPLDDLVTEIDAMSTPDDLGAVVAALHDAGASALFWFGPGFNLAKSGPLVAYVEPSGIGLPSRSDYTKPDVQVIDAYRDHISRLEGLVDIGDDAMPEAVITIETRLAKAMADSATVENGSGPFHLDKLSDLEKRAPHFPWKGYFAASKAPSFSGVADEFPVFFDALDAMLADTSPDDLKAYLTFRAIEAFADSLDDDVVAEEYRFHEGEFYGFTTPLPREEYCLRQAAAALPWPLGEAYLGAAFSTDRADAAKDLMSRARGAFENRLAKVTWLDTATRSAAEKKLAAMRTETGGPTSWPSTEGLTVDASSFVVAQADVLQFYRRQSIAQIGHVDHDPWFDSPIVFDAYYSPPRNAVNVTAAFLQSPNFDPSFDPVVNAGAMGSVMGHEMTHGFDAMGRLYDGDGLLRDWWSKATEASFDQRTDCLVKQYDAFAAAPSLFVDGNRTLNENIADLGGVHIAFDAAHPTGDDARAFFVAYAQSLCENDQPDYLETLVATDAHAPAKARVNALLANVSEFAEAFSCAAGTPMAPKNRCTVW